ncbi:MAG: superoxide dismutase family protein [Betaproteobacteria bacterium]
MATLRGGIPRSTRLASSGLRDRSPRSDFRRATLAAVLAGLLASCASDGKDSRNSPPAPIIGATLRPTNASTVNGLVTFEQTAAGLKANATIYTGRQGRWRVVIHETGVCTSPNGFSAGPPYILPGATQPSVVVITTTEDGIGIDTSTLPGLTLDGPSGITGKSVVVHYGATTTLEAEPGVRNNRIACGIIGVVKPFAP